MAAVGAFTVTIYSGAMVNETNPIIFTTTVPALAVDARATVNGVLTGQPANSHSTVTLFARFRG